MKKIQSLRPKTIFLIFLAISYSVVVMAFVFSGQALAGDSSTPPEPYVAIHVSELTRALETWPAMPPTPTGPGTSGYEWWYTSWHYFVLYESLEEMLRSDGTPFVRVTDSDIATGRLLNPDGSPRYPIMISLASEAMADNQIIPLLNYVNAGGFLFVGSSAFTRTWDGFPRGDFALAKEMGLQMVNPGLLNWYQNTTFTKGTNHTLTSHIPSGKLTWRMPLFSDQIPWGIDPGTNNFADVHNEHFVWQVSAKGATVLATGDSGPLLTVKPYGLGQIIWHGAFQPLIGHGGFDSSMYAYFIYRKAIEWSFATLKVPMIKVSPWTFPYDAALMVRHDFENDLTLINSIQSSAQFEKSAGVKGDYYFSTGALRTYTGSDRSGIIAALQNAVTNYGATIGSHNGGLKHPANASLSPAAYDYWHWGPDEALDQHPAGYADGAAYASKSILMSFQDIEGWLNGLDNGRTGCGALKNCPRLWASPFFNSTREPSMKILQQLGSIGMGEQKISPFPHWTLSYETADLYYPHVSPPTSEWYVGSGIAQSLEGHSIQSIRAGVDFYYTSGLLLNFYGHKPSNDGGVSQEYVTYSKSKSNLWSTNAVGLYDWWLLRSKVRMTPTFTRSAGLNMAKASISGATDSQTAVEITLPAVQGQTVSNLAVLLNGVPVNSSKYRTTITGALKILTGSSVSNVEVQYALSTVNNPPVAVNDTYSCIQNVTLVQGEPGILGNDTDSDSPTLTASLVTGPAHGTLTLNANGSFVYTPALNFVGTDSFTYKAGDGTNSSNAATVTINVLSLLASVSLNSTSVVGGTSSQGTVTLSGSAPSGGVVVSLSDNSLSVTMPSSVTIPSGKNSATFTITTRSVYRSTSVSISAVYNGLTKTAVLQVTR